MLQSDGMINIADIATRFSLPVLFVTEVCMHVCFPMHFTSAASSLNMLINSKYTIDQMLTAFFSKFAAGWGA